MCEQIPLEQIVVGQVKEEKMNCSVLQLTGPLLADNTLTEAGTVTVVFYAELQSPGGRDYRVYSIPVTIEFVQ